MIKEGTIYWLFYSANLWGTPNYSIGIAACTSVTGPCVKPLDRAWHMRPTARTDRVRRVGVLPDRHPHLDGAPRARAGRDGNYVEGGSTST